MSTIQLDGRVAIVTGGSKGIGLSVSRTFAAHGAHLIIGGYSDEKSLQKCAEAITDEYGVNVYTVFGDVCDSAVSSTAVKTAFKYFKRLDILVNNAGVLDDSLIGMISNDVIDRVLSTNIKGVINFTQDSARLMARNDGGSIINMSSIIGRVGNSGQLVYSASKAAVIGATLSSAKELASKNIRVNAIAPGYIDTDMIAHLEQSTDRQRRASIPMARIGTPQDVADTALFLASDLSTYVTKQVINVDGGMLI